LKFRYLGGIKTKMLTLNSQVYWAVIMIFLHDYDLI